MSDYSLDSLTTPNQSPSPEPEQSALKTASSAATGLDSDSDLSELTEDEQEAEKQDGKNNNRNLDEDEDNDEDGSGRKRSSRRGRRKRGGLVPAPMWEWAKRKEPSSSPVPEEEEEENVDGIPQAMEEEEGEEEDEDDDDDDVPPVVARTSRGRANKPLDDDDDDEGPEAEEDVPEDEYMSDVEQSTLTAKTSARTVRADPSRLTASASNPRHPSNSNFDFDDDDDPLSDPPTGLPEDVTDYPNENELETESEDEEKDPAPAKLDLKTLPVVAETDLLPEIDLDVTAPSPMAVAPVAAAAAASSIMAGSFVIENPPSPSSSNSGSAASSRSASPMQEDAADRPSEGAKKRDSKATDMLPPPVIRKISDSAAGFDEEGEPVEVDEPSPDQELEMELESDLQPAHRAEALDSLAGIELKFARLRERLYVEKLEQLAWEETLVHEGEWHVTFDPLIHAHSSNTGNHPELIYLQTELTKRRDKRIELATRKRSYEVASINKRRRDEEEATWGWWKLARDELQTEMFTETNRKRRKLERERRAFDRPIQPRYIPPKPLYQIPPPPTLRQIVQESPFTSRRAQHAKKELQLPHFATPLVYPGLTSLPPTEIQGDLEYLFQHRRGPNPNPASMPHPAQTHPNPSQLAGYDQNYMVNGNSLPPQGGDVHGSNPPTFGGGGNRMPPPNFPSQHPVGHPPPGPLPGLPPFAGPGREQPFPTDYDMDASGSAMGSKVLPPPNNSYFGAAPSVGMNSGNGFMANPNGHLVLRRSSSPPLPSGQGDVREKQNGGWPGAKVEPQSHWAGELRRHEMDVDEREHRSKENRREKERARERSEWERSEREREREHAEMTRLMVAQEQRERDQHLQRDRHAPPPVQHPHLHGAPPTQHHHHHHHHHPDHHHHVVHHHHSVAPLINNGHQPPPPSVLPLSVPNGQSPRFGPSREFEGSRPHSRHHDRDPGILSLSNNKPGWKEESHAQEYREPRHRDRHGQSRPSSTRPLMEERERPSSSSASYGLTSSGPPNPGPSSQGNWNQNEDPSLRLPPPPLPAASGSGSYLGSVEGVGNSPGRRYSGGGRSLQPARQDSTTRSPPRPRPPQAVLSLGPGSSPSSSSAYPRSPMRHSGPPPPPSQPLNTLPPMSSSHTGTSPTHKIHRPHSPPHPSKNNLGGAGGYASPRFPGMSRTLTPTGMPPPLEPKSNPANGRTSPPSMPFPPPSLSTYQPPASLPPPPTRSSGGTASPRLPSQGKMAVAQMIDGH